MKLRYFQYRFPFVQPFRTSQNTFNAREGILLQLQRDGLTAYGEAAPLSGFSHENLDQVKSQLKKYSTEITGFFQEEIVQGGLDDFFESYDIVPSLCFALDTLVCDYLSQKEGYPISHLLFEHPQTSLPVNAVVPIQSVSETLQSVVPKIKQGYQTFKFKIGKDFAEKLSVLQHIRDRFPDITVRIDANQSWDFEQALDNLEILGKLDIEYCEEPLARPSLRALEKISASSPVPVALDETLADFDIIRSVAAFVPVLIMKPMIIGSLSKLFKTKQFAKTYGNKIVFTTTLESGIGRMMTAILAAGLGSQQTAYGLATGGFLKTDVWYDGTYINNGYFSLPDDPGLGKKYRFDPQNLAEEIHFRNK